MRFFSIRQWALKNLTTNFSYKEYMGIKPYSHYYSKDKLINYYDWWKCDAEKIWFTKFIRHIGIKNTKFNFYGVFGNNKYINQSIEGKKIFFTGENIDAKDYCLNSADLSLGFENINYNNYMRFPLWVMYLFPPESDEADIVQIICDINQSRYIKQENCVAIASHDKYHTREKVCDGLKEIFDIKYAGKWRNNTDELWNSYSNDKISYMRKFKFNICPENSNVDGYVTEKLFEAMVSDCIPIYYGGNLNPEPKIINKKCVITWDVNASNDNSIKEIEKLLSNENYYREYKEQNKFLPSATEYVIEMFNNLKNRFMELAK